MDLPPEILNALGSDEIKKREQFYAQVEGTLDFERLFNAFNAIALYASTYDTADFVGLNGKALLRWCEREGVSLDALQAVTARKLADVMKDTKEPSMTAMFFLANDLATKLSKFGILMFMLGFEHHEKNTTFIDFLLANLEEEAATEGG
jgi:hypothetical protein